MNNRVFVQWLIIGLLLGCAISVTVAAQEAMVAPIDPLKAAEQHNARRQALANDAEAIERLRQETRFMEATQTERLDAISAEQLTEAVVEQAQVESNAIKLRRADLQADIASSERRINALGQIISDLEEREQLLQNPAKDEIAGAERAEQLRLTQQALEQQRVNLELERQHLTNLGNRLELLGLRLTQAEQWQSELDKLYRLQQRQNRQEAHADLLRRLEGEQQAQQERAEELRNRLEQQADSLSQAQRLWLETRIQGAEDKSDLFQLDIRLAKTEDEIKRLTDLLEQPETNLEDLQQGLEQLQSLQSILLEADELWQKKIALLEQQQQAIERREVSGAAERRWQAEATKTLAELIKSSKQRLERVQAQAERIQETQRSLNNYYAERINRELLVRESLPATSAEWQRLLSSMANAPKVLVHQLRLSAKSSLEAVINASFWRWAALIVMELGLVWFVIWIRRRLKRLILKAKASEDKTFFGRAALTVLQLLRKNLLGAGLAAALILMIWMFQVPQPGLAIIVTVVLLWVGIKTPINLAWLLLAAPQLPEAYQRPHLYRQVFWALLIGGMLAAMTILAHLSGIPENVVSAFDRLFMAYWLWVSIPAFRIRRLLVDLLAARYGGRFWFVSLRLTTLLWPSALLIAAGLGLLGYLNLAWLVAWYLLMFLAVLVGWLIARGLLGDLAILLKNYAVTHSSFGLLWTQDVINPLHKILRLLLFISACVTLFLIYGWTRESVVTDTLWRFLGHSLFTLGGATITIQGILIILAIILAVIWLGQWSRAITYRWLLSNISDLGIRHSLSVFSQYTIVLIGLLITLNIIGINLTTLTVFAGAFGVVLGFGMQATANNFISGLLLLIERPLRSGDFVKIGTSEGEITRIGIRSLTVKTWDNMEVIIPNADVITNSFTNWTHQDKIIRTVLMVRVSYSSDPHQARATMEQVLADHPAVLKEPESMVLLWEFDDSSFNFRVQYFLDLGKHGLFLTRTQVMFAIWDALQKAGIKIPYPQRDLHIKHWPERGAQGSAEKWPPTREGTE